MKILFIFLLFVVYFALSLSLESKNAIGLYLIISLGLFFWGVIEWKLFINRRDAENRRRLEEQLAEIPHTQSLISNNLLNIMLIDDVGNFLYILQRDSLGEDFNIDPISFSKVLEVALVEEGEIINLYPKKGLLGSTLLQDQAEMEEDFDEEDEEDDDDAESIEALCLRIVVDDLINPILEYPFIADDHSFEIDSEEYAEVNALCNDWYQKICIIIKRYEHTNVAVRLWE
ncbi:hypothetical protein [Psychrobacillus antarcticus]|uniref:hypothetical protein n=1 Tax=Psychrobacillus antarcticus TaxID=2879115 RepID=UPI002407A6DB|nr:hypothetical protein [Psychrobacillus antarcticus]